MKIKNRIIFAEEGKHIARATECAFAEDFGTAFPMRERETEKDFVEVSELPAPRPEQPTINYDEEVNNLIREKYTESQEFAILRQRDTKPQEFEEYNAYCEECKKKVKARMI